MYRSSFTSMVLHLHPRRVPEASAGVRHTWCMGGLSVWLFTIEIVTGALLLLHYAPTVGGAYLSVQNITHVVPYGFFIRNLHYWCGQLMVICVFLHMVRVYSTGSYTPPRRLNWVIGIALLVGTLMVDFTGYLLVWDDRSLWAWTIARNLANETPLVGSAVAAFLFGPADVGDAAIVRLYVQHIILLPGLMTALMAWHFWRVRKDGGISVPL